MSSSDAGDHHDPDRARLRRRRSSSSPTSPTSADRWAPPVVARVGRRIVHPVEPAYRRHRVFDYRRFVDRMLARPRPDLQAVPVRHPGLGQHAAPRRGGVVLRGSTPAEYERWLRGASTRSTPFGPDENLVFINAWNEWAEGNHLEPCQRWGRGYLEATRRVMVGP